MDNSWQGFVEAERPTDQRGSHKLVVPGSISLVQFFDNVHK